MIDSEPWLDKRALAGYLSCGVRTVERALADGMPHVVIFGRVKFRVSEVEPWLEANGQMQRAANGHATKLVEPVTSRPGGGVNAPGPDIEE